MKRFIENQNQIVLAARLAGDIRTFDKFGGSLMLPLQAKNLRTNIFLGMTAKTNVNDIRKEVEKCSYILFTNAYLDRSKDKKTDKFWYNICPRMSSTSFVYGYDELPDINRVSILGNVIGEKTDSSGNTWIGISTSYSYYSKDEKKTVWKNGADGRITRVLVQPNANSYKNHMIYVTGTATTQQVDDENRGLYIKSNDVTFLT